MRLVISKSQSGWKWMVEKSVEAQQARYLDGAESLHADVGGAFSTEEFERSHELSKKDGNSPLLAQTGHERWSTLRGSVVSTGNMHEDRRARRSIPWIFAVADPCEKWWLRLRGNPKRAGEISQAAFLLRAEMKGFHLALPWGDSERYDFVVWSQDGRKICRVQVKGTGRLHRRGYEVQPVHSTRNGGKKRYTKKDVDVIAAHVQPLDAWYLIPIEKVGRAKSLRLYPGDESATHAKLPTAKKSKSRMRRASRVWERWRDAWEVLEDKA